MVDACAAAARSPLDCGVSAVVAGLCGPLRVKKVAVVPQSTELPNFRHDCGAFATRVGAQSKWMHSIMDPNLQNFYTRVARIQSARALGYGFEAEGTIGRSAYARPQPRKLSLVKPLVIMAIAILGLKATIHHHVGDDSYAARVAVLQASDGFDRLGGYLMEADPVTLWLSAQITVRLGGLL